MKRPHTAAEAAARLSKRPMRALRNQLVQPPTAATLPPGVTKPSGDYADDYKPMPLASKDDRDDVQNPHKVNQSAWRKWDGQARRAFNSLFSFMMNNQRLFHHPEALASLQNGKGLEPKHWETVAHNAAWTAAEGIMGRYSGDEMGVGESARAATRVSGKSTVKSPSKSKPVTKKATISTKNAEKAVDKVLSTKAKAGNITKKGPARSRPVKKG